MSNAPVAAAAASDGCWHTARLDEDHTASERISGRQERIVGANFSTLDITASAASKGAGVGALARTAGVGALARTAGVDLCDVIVVGDRAI